MNECPPASFSPNSLPPTGCPQSSRIGPMLDGELADAARSGLDLHLQACAPCRQELRELQGVSHLLQSEHFSVIATSSPLPPAALGRIHARISAVMEQVALARRQALWLRGRVLRIAHAFTAVAASILVVATIWLYNGRRSHRSAISEAPRPSDAWERSAVLSDDASASYTQASFPSVFASPESDSAVSVGGLVSPVGEEAQE